MSGHTPGPWSDVHAPREGVKIVANGPFAPIGQRVAWVAADDTEQLASGRVVERCSAEARANARLIACAPDLLAACEAVIAQRDAGMDLALECDRELEAMCAAIAKARGGK